MSPTARRSIAIGVFVVMLVVAVVSLILASHGRESWLLVGGAMTVAIGAFVQVLSVSRTGERVVVTPRGRALILGLAVVAVAFLVVAGITSSSAFTVVIAVLFLAGLVATVWGGVLLSRKPVRREAA